MKVFRILVCAALLLPLLAAAGPRNKKNASSWSILPPGQLQELLKDQPYAPGAVDTMLFSLPEAEQKELKTLAASDPEAARNFIAVRMDARKQRKAARATAIRKSAAAVRASRDQEEKAKLTADLRKLVQEEFDETSREIEIQLKRQELRLKEVRAGYQKRITEAEKLIDKRMERLLTPPRKRARKEKDGSAPRMNEADAKTGATPKAKAAADPAVSPEAAGK